MRKTALTLLAAVGLAACGDDTGVNVRLGGNTIKGSGDLVTRELDFDRFTRVKIGSTFRATVKPGLNHEVKVRIDDNVLDRLVVTRADDLLTVRLEDGSYNNLTLLVDIVLPDLTYLEVSGASRADLLDFAVDHAVEIAVSGASHLTGDISTGQNPLTCRVSGASHLTLDGSGGDLDARVSGASHLNLGDFSCADADLDLSGASHATVNMSGTLDAKLSAASNLRYKGNPTLGNISTNGASSIADAN